MKWTTIAAFATILTISVNVDASESWTRLNSFLRVQDKPQATPQAIPAPHAEAAPMGSKTVMGGCDSCDNGCDGCRGIWRGYHGKSSCGPRFKKFTFQKFNMLSCGGSCSRFSKLSFNKMNMIGCNTCKGGYDYECGKGSCGGCSKGCKPARSFRMPSFKFGKRSCGKSMGCESKGAGCGAPMACGRTARCGKSSCCGKGFNPLYRIHGGSYKPLCTGTKISGCGDAWDLFKFRLRKRHCRAGHGCCGGSGCSTCGGGYKGGTIVEEHAAPQDEAAPMIPTPTPMTDAPTNQST